jgi:hypothetical protein
MCKRSDDWAAVGRPRVARTAGNEGIVITPAHVSKMRTIGVAKISSKIGLINESTLAELIFEFGAAVATISRYG